MLNNVLVIDDDETSIFVTKHRIIKSGFAKNVLSFTYSHQAISYLEQLPSLTDAAPDMIFLDLNMPFMNGWKFLDLFTQHFLPRFPTTTVCILSSLIPSEEVKSTIPPYVIAFINKPLSTPDLEALINHENLESYFRSTSSNLQG
ncbi:response regulator [Telluribacter humicola]|uniref:response regulator n=1 Tax=Telluribacter humicola TaxID=1720261 RepID=UPI001A9773CA|nr:response regulator [Telluribacter humicola]